jgi:tRNA threonylcarbamoyladenosine biosynthesis protein TsaE
VTTRITNSEGETAAVGRDLARQLDAGRAVLLEGPLGAGKTAFARGLAEGLGCDPDDVSSPTFTIMQEYRGRTPLLHVDLYRLTPAEVDDLGLDEMLVGHVVAVEWPDRWRDAPADAIRVTIVVEAGSRRRIAIGGPLDGPAMTESGPSGDNRA